MSSVRPALRVALVTLVTFVAVGCGDLYSDPDKAQLQSPTNEQPPDFIVDASATIPRDFVTPCPPYALEGSSCDIAGLTCEYGSSADQRCNTTLSCEPDLSFAQTWVARPSTLCPSYACPAADAALGTIDGTPCNVPASDAAPPSDADELVCPMADGICACSTGVDATHAHARKWVCVKPTSGCPQTRPLVGQDCTSARSCDYGSCEFKRGMRMECESSAWISGGATCK